MKEKYIDLINDLDSKNIIKIDISFGSKNKEVESVFDKNYTDVFLIDFFYYLYTNKYLIIYDDINREDLLTREYLTGVIDWGKLVEDKLITDSSNMYIILRDKPKTYEVLFGKSLFLSMLDYYKYINPSQAIWALDGMVFMVLSEKKDLDLSLSDAYSNLLFFTESIPFKKTKYFDPKYYDDILIEMRGYGMTQEDREIMEDIKLITEKKDLADKAQHINPEDISDVENI